MERLTTTFLTMPDHLNQEFENRIAECSTLIRAQRWRACAVEPITDENTNFTNRLIGKIGKHKFQTLISTYCARDDGNVASF